MRESETNMDGSNERPSTEQNVYADVYKILLGGMLASTALFLVGIVEALLRPQFVPLTSDWIKQHYHWAVLVKGVASFEPTSIMLVATILLISTPVARVLVSIYAFLVDRDYKFAAVTSLVFLVMVLTVVLGLLGLK